MGDVATLFKIYFDPEKEERVKEKIKEEINPKDIKLEDVAFGIKVMKVLVVHKDEEGSAKYEEKIRGIEGVNEVEVEEETLI
ncbi:MAG: hypothetical protein QXL16_02865 [Candidatus Micrarchaeaceae archaeon]